MPSELGELIEEEDTVVGPRPLAWQRAAPDHAHVRNGVVRGATWPGGDYGGAPPGEAGDAVVRVVSMASATVRSVKVVVRRRASTDVPAPGGPRGRAWGSERLHGGQLHSYDPAFTTPTPWSIANCKAPSANACARALSPAAAVESRVGCQADGPKGYYC